MEETAIRALMLYYEVVFVVAQEICGRLQKWLEETEDPIASIQPLNCGQSKL